MNITLITELVVIELATVRKLVKRFDIQWRAGLNGRKLNGKSRTQ